MTTKERCPWAGSDPRYQAYHDEEWGVPCHDDRVLFEFLVLEGAQAGLSWSTILNKRENYRRLLHDFDPVRVARFTARDEARLLGDAGIVRNRLKVASLRTNARAFLEVQAEHGSFAAYLWSFVGGSPIQNRWTTLKQIPAITPEAKALSKALLGRGFRFVGPTICYAYMQAMGLVNDHLTGCFRRGPVERLARGGQVR
ncbi:MAG: DNA-3-methyladenine glycosylase I [Candidatus Eisenbacteria bacterium]